MFVKSVREVSTSVFLLCSWMHFFPASCGSLTTAALWFFFFFGNNEYKMQNGQMSSPQRTFKCRLVLSRLKKVFSKTCGLWCWYPMLETDDVRTTHAIHDRGQSVNSNFHLLIQPTFWSMSLFSRYPSEHKPNISKNRLLVPFLHHKLTKSSSLLVFFFFFFCLLPCFGDYYGGYWVAGGELGGVMSASTLIFGLIWPFKPFLRIY